MDVLTVITSVGSMTVIILFGAILALRTEIGAESKQLLISIIINVAMPFIILNGIFHSDMNGDLFKKIILIFLSSIVINCFGIGLGLFVAKLLKFESLRSKQIAILAGLGNTGFIGVPLCMVIFGPTGGLYAAVFDSGLDFTIFTVGVMLLQKESKFTFRQLKALINPPTIAITGGLFLAYFNVQMPIMVKQLTVMLAGLASPMAMLYIGLLIPAIFKYKKKVPALHLGVPITLKLLVMPLIVISLLAFIPLPMDLKQVLTIQASMPVITLASLLFTKYGHDEDFGAMTTIVSTLVSLLTIPIIVLYSSKILF